MFTFSSIKHLIFHFADQEHTLGPETAQVQCLIPQFQQLSDLGQVVNNLGSTVFSSGKWSQQQQCPAPGSVHELVTSIRITLNNHRDSRDAERVLMLSGCSVSDEGSARWPGGGSNLLFLDFTFTFPTFLFLNIFF